MTGYTCPECGAKIESPDGLEGGTDFCPECRSAVEVPPPWVSESLEEKDEDRVGESEVHESEEDEERQEDEEPIVVFDAVLDAREATAPPPEDTPPSSRQRLLLLLGCLGPIVMLVVCVLLLNFAAWLAPKILPWLVIASYFALAVSVLILLPLSLIRPTRMIGGVGMMYASYVFGITVWFGGFFLTYTIWGMGAVIVGLFLFGVGVVPIAMLATLFNAMWGKLLWLIVLLVLVWGTRIFGAWAAVKAEREEQEMEERRWADSDV